MHRGQRCWAVCNMQASPLLHASQWTTHLVDAVQFGQTRGLFLLLSGLPRLRGGAGSETGSTWTVGSSTHIIVAAVHWVPVQELVQGQTLSQELSMNVLLAEQLVEHLEADLWVKRKVIFALHPKCEEQNRMLGFNLTTGARNMVEHRRPSIPWECQGSYPHLKYNTFLICQLTRM